MLALVSFSPASCSTSARCVGAMGLRPLYLPAALARPPPPLALQHHFPFELRHTPEYRQHQLACWRVGVHPQVQHVSIPDQRDR